MKKQTREDICMNTGYEGVARWSAILYSIIWLFADVYRAAFPWIACICNLVCFMFFGLGLRSIAISACRGGEVRAKDLFRAFSRTQITRSLVLGAVIVLLWKIPNIAGRYLPPVDMSIIYLICYGALYLVAEAASTIGTAHARIRPSSLVQKTWCLLKCSFPEQIRLLLRHALAFAGVFFILLIIFYNTDRSITPERINLALRILYPLFAIISGPRFFLRENHCMLTAMASVENGEDAPNA